MLSCGAQAHAKSERFILLTRQAPIRLLRQIAEVFEALAKRTLDRRLWGLSGRGYCTFHAFLEELEILGLKGKCFGPEEYAHRLALYLGIEIRIELVLDADNPEALGSFVESGHTACLWYDERAGIARILVLSSLRPLEMTAAIYHELGHLAAGHRLAVYDSQGVASGARKALVKSLARNLPVTDDLEAEREANLREGFALTAGALGELYLESESQGQLA